MPRKRAVTAIAVDDGRVPPPKRPTNAFMLWSVAQRAALKNQFPSKTFGERSKIAGANWKKLSDKNASKAKYLKQAAKTLKAYKKKKEEWKQLPVEKQANPPPSKRVRREKREKKAAKRALGGPMRSRSAYLFFCKDRRKTLKNSHPNLTQQEIMKKLGRLWASASVANKKVRPSWHTHIAQLPSHSHSHLRASPLSLSHTHTEICG